ncbi:MAG: efflux RND transporter permease subunit, partial [Kiritimatiellia bacterium]|nr:efflux RND transporter permease subunit [Lentisphaerota bacterium]
LGMNTAGVGHFLRTAVYGTTASKFRAGEDEYDITVRLREDQRQSTDMLNQIFIPQPAGNPVPLSALGTADYTGGRGVITRKNRKRVITISGDLQQRSIDAVLKDIQGQLAGMRLPPGYTITYTGENQEMNEAGAFLSKAFMLTIGLIFVILVIQFNSALTPLIILAAVVLSMIGVMWGMLICGLRFSIIMTGLGIISLAGVVVNNAIVLVDCIRQRLLEGMPVREAVVTAGRMRFRPVLLTATTTILGLLPMAVGYSVDIHSWPWKIVAGAESSQWWAPMAVAIIFGLGVATMMTLIIVPVMFSLAHGTVAWTLRKRQERNSDQDLQNTDPS